MNHCDGEKRVEACSETFPAADQAAVFALKPGTRPFGLDARDIPFDGAPTRLSGRPHPCGDLGANPASAEATAKVLGVLSCIRR
jgi:hypothetical protein